LHTQGLDTDLGQRLRHGNDQSENQIREARCHMPGRFVAQQ
jgi:hypothetical protein